MGIRLFNTMSGRKEQFEPLEPGVVRLYTCGPTVYDFAHIGNFRAYLFEELLRRHLEYRNHRVTQVMNITDVDDKTIAGSNRAGLSLREFTDRYLQAFFEDLDTLRVKRADIYPRATDHVAEMVEIIAALLDRGFAYQSEGDVYFRISSFPAYGRLAKLDRQGLRPGARVAVDEYDKETATDFALWKARRPGEPSWDAPFGPGRPGWHIECSAMSMKYLGSGFDIHTGGVDNVFPHHENEIAQSEAYSGSTFVRYWLHCEHLLVDGEKMSKSKGNFHTLRDLLDAGHDPDAIRYLLLASTHYRSKLNFTESGLRASAEALRRMRTFAARVHQLEPEGEADWIVQEANDAAEHFGRALDDDLNLPLAMGYFFDLAREANSAMDRAAIGVTGKLALERLISIVDHYFDLLTDRVDGLDAELIRLIELRQQARSAKDYALADQLRDRLAEAGVALEDSKDGVRWTRVRR